MFSIVLMCYNLNYKTSFSMWGNVDVNQNNPNHNGKLIFYTNIHLEMFKSLRKFMVSLYIPYTKLVNKINDTEWYETNWRSISYITGVDHSLIQYLVLMCKIDILKLFVESNFVVNSDKYKFIIEDYINYETFVFCIENNFIKHCSLIDSELTVKSEECFKKLEYLLSTHQSDFIEDTYLKFHINNIEEVRKYQEIMKKYKHDNYRFIWKNDNIVDDEIIQQIFADDVKPYYKTHFRIKTYIMNNKISIKSLEWLYTKGYILPDQGILFLDVFTEDNKEHLTNVIQWFNDHKIKTVQNQSLHI